MGKKKKAFPTPWSGPFPPIYSINGEGCFSTAQQRYLCRPTNVHFSPGAHIAITKNNRTNTVTFGGGLDITSPQGPIGPQGIQGYPGSNSVSMIRLSTVSAEVAESISLPEIPEPTNAMNGMVYFDGENLKLHTKNMWKIIGEQ